MAIVDDIRRKQEATKGLISDEQIERMRVLWKKGRNMFSSFFTEADAARQQINSDTLFASWCFFQLQIDVQTISNVAVVLKQDDAARVRNEFAEAKRAEKENRESEAHARRMKAQERKNALDAKKAENALEKAKKAAEAAAAKKAATAAKNKAARERKVVEQGDALARAKIAWMANPNATLDAIRKIAYCDNGTASHSRKLLETEGLLAPKSAASSEGALYEQYVEKGRAAVLAEGESRWTQGDLGIAVSALKNYGDLKRFAADIGVEYGTLRNRQAVAVAWPKVSPRGGFSVCRELAPHPDRHAILAREPLMTVEDARETMRKYRATTNVVPLTGKV